MKIQLTEKTIPLGRSQVRNGAELTFHGIVRGIEEGKSISGIHYSPYPEMVEKEFAAILQEGEEEFGEHEVVITHRLGFVKAGEAAIEIRVSSKRSQPAFDLCPWYLSQIKKRVPIWKEPRYDSKAPSSSRTTANPTDSQEQQ